MISTIPGVFNSRTYPVQTVQASGTSQVCSFPDDWYAGEVVYDITLSAPCTISLVPGLSTDPQNNASVVFQRCILILRQPATGSGYAVTLPSARYPGGTAPVVSTSAGQVTIITFATSDGGITIFGGI